MTLQVFAQNILSAMSQLELSQGVCVCLWLCWTDFWIESFEFESRSAHSILNSTWGRMCFICLLAREWRESTRRQLYQGAGEWIGIYWGNFSKVELHLLCLRNYYNFGPSARSGPVSFVLSSSNYESTLCALTKIFLLLSFESILGPPWTVETVRGRKTFAPASGNLEARVGNPTSASATAASAIACSASGCHNWCELPHC